MKLYRVVNEWERPHPEEDLTVSVDGMKLKLNLRPVSQGSYVDWLRDCYERLKRNSDKLKRDPQPDDTKRLDYAIKWLNQLMDDQHGRRVAPVTRKTIDAAMKGKE